MSSLREIFEQEGTLRDVAGNQPLALNDPESVWLINTGYIDVFADMAIGDEAAGSRVHLARVEPGGLLVGSQTDAEHAFGLVASGIAGSEVYELPKARFRELTDDKSVRPEVFGLLSQWISALTAGAAGGPMPRDTVLLNPGASVRLQVGKIVSPSRMLLLTGSTAPCEFLGKATLSLTEDDWYFPLADCGWISVADDATVKVLQAEPKLDDDRFWVGLDRFHEIMAACAAINEVEAAGAERNRLARKAQFEEQQSAAAISQLAAAAQPESAADVPMEMGDDPLLAACRIVGERLNLTIQPPRNYGEKQWTDPVSAIARASGIRSRSVALAGKWWEQDNGPLLAFLIEGDQPVALLPTANGYDLIDPVSRTRTRLTAANRSSLGALAYCFYRSFPSHSLSPKDVFKFGLHGTRRDWIAIIAFGIAAAILGLFIPVATGWIFGDIIPSGSESQLLLLVMALGVNAIVSTLFGLVQGIAVLRLETRMDSSVEAGVWDRLLNLPASFFRQYTAGDLTMRAMGIGQIRQAFTDAAMSSLLTFVFSMISFFLLFYYDARLGLVSIVLFLFIVGATAVATYYQLPYERKQYDVRGRVAGIVLQLMTGISRLRIAGAENRALAYWTRHYSEQTKLSFRSQEISNNLSTLMAAVPVFSTLIIYGFVSLFPSESLTLSSFLAFSAAFTGIVASAVGMSSTVSTVLDVVPLYERSRSILETAPEFHTAMRDPGDLTGNIEIGEVSFRYQDAGPLVLDEVSVEIQPGEFVAFVGPSGAGKSTILRLLLGFENPETGSIYYDREDFAQLDHQAVRRQIGVVLQNSRLTSGDIFRNIVGSAPLTLEDAWEAAKLSGLDDDIKQMPMGMHTVISEGESTLSGGQRQRLMIARAIVNKPKILLFDEATSALDNVTQETVARSLDALKATRIVIAHRLSTIMNADRIYVMERGKIVQSGTFDELMQNSGLFADLAKRQML